MIGYRKAISRFRACDVHRRANMLGIDARMLCHPIHTRMGPVTVRPILPGDADMMQAFVGNLSGTSCYFRFLQPLKLLSPSMLKQLTCIDYQTHMALVALTPVRGTSRIIGEARYVSTDGAVAAEIAIVVADEWQCCGVGAGLIQILEGIAAANGMTRLTGEAFASNGKIRRFAQAFGFEIWPDHDSGHLRIEKGIDRNALSLFPSPR
jgi:acetyltransferase